MIVEGVWAVVWLTEPGQVIKESHYQYSGKVDGDIYADERGVCVGC